LPINAERNEVAKNRLLEALRRKDSLALVGAGVSTWAGYHSWAQVIQHLAQAVHRALPDVDTQAIIHNNRNPLHCAKHLGGYLGSDFGSFIETEFGPNNRKPNDLLFQFCSFPFRHFLTLNFDYSLEQVHAILGRQCQSITTRNLVNLLKFMRSQDENDTSRCVLHLHGSFDDPPEYIALTNDGYARLYQDGTTFRKFVWWLTTSKCLVFVGFGFTDSDFLNAMRQSAWDLRDERSPFHYAIRGIPRGENDEALRNELYDSYKIDSVFYELAETERDRHEGFAALIRQIAEELALPALAPKAKLEVPAAPVGAPEPEDLRQAERLARELVQKVDPGGNDVPH
jgi:SIR2-like protein